MAQRIQRQTQKIFGGNAAIDELAVFGSMNTGNPIYTDNIETLQSSAYEEGWSAAIAANEAPWLEELNGVQYGLSKQILYNHQEGVAEYDENTTYFIGSWCKGIDEEGNRKLYESLADNNIGHPVTDIQYWQEKTFGNDNISLPIGSIYPVVCSTTYVPTGALACDGGEYNESQFTQLWTNYLTGETPLLKTCTYEEYKQMLTTYGSCPMFGVDEENLKFRVPFIKDGSVIQQAQSDDEIGKAYNAGLPNITASVANASVGGNGKLPPVSGAFNVEGTSVMLYGGSGQLYTNNAILSFDASKSNSIYGGSKTVQPNAVSLRYFVVVASGTINDSQMDWSEWASSLQNKLSTDLSNLPSSSKTILTNLSMPSTRYIDLTIPANNTILTAPADGIFYLKKTIEVEGNYNLLENITAHFIAANQPATIGGGAEVWILASKGDQVRITYLTKNSPGTLRFVYMNGAE